MKRTVLVIFVCYFVTFSVYFLGGGNLEANVNLGVAAAMAPAMAFLYLVRIMKRLGEND